MFPTAAWIGPAGWLHVAGYGVVLPWLAFRTARRLNAPDRPLPNRLIYLRSTAFTLVVLTAFSLAVARVQWIGLFPRGTTRWGAGLAAGAAMYLAAVALMRPRWRKAVLERKRIVYLFMPETPAERAWWIAVAFLAGVGEEITWRGVQTALLVPVTGSYAAAVSLSAFSFAFGHVMQGWRSVAVILLFALGFAGIVAISGSLYVAMMVHVAYDVTAGLTYGRLGRELGYALPTTASSSTPASGA